MKDLGQAMHLAEMNAKAEKARSDKLAARILQAKTDFTKDWENGVLNLENLSWALAMDEVDPTNISFNELVAEKQHSHAVPILRAAISQEKFQVRSTQSKRWLPPSTITEAVLLSDLEVSRDDFVKWTELLGYSLPRILHGLPTAMDVTRYIVSPLPRGAKPAEQDEKLLEIIIKKLRCNPMQLRNYSPRTPGSRSDAMEIALGLGFNEINFKKAWERLSNKKNPRIAYADKACPPNQVKK